MSDHPNETRASLIISSEVMSGQRIAEVLRLNASKIVIKGTPTERADVSEHPFHIAMFDSALNVEQRLERHLAAVLEICERREDELLSLIRDCQIHVHCTYLARNEGGWTLTQDLCRRMALLPMEFVFAVDTATVAD